jgi:LysM repeat protein
MSTALRVTWSALLLIALLLVGIRPVSAQEPGVHVVRVGESLTAIAARYGTTVAVIAQANSLKNLDWVYVGQKLTIPGASSSSTVAAGGVHVVRAGESLTIIAQRYGTTAAAIASANGLANQNFIYSGQRLTIPGSGSAPSAAGATAAVASGVSAVHIVKAGESLAIIATRYSVSAASIASANGIVNQNMIYAGQRLTIPGATAAATAAATATPVPPTPAPTQPPMPAAGSANDGRWIDVNLTTQTLVAFEGETAVFTARTSTGLPGTPTVVGRYTIQSKYPAVHMSGPGYSLPNVPWTMFFYKGYAIHGAYWHNKFGQPMSHGCVNLSVADAQWVYNFASVGTLVVTHY